MLLRVTQISAADPSTTAIAAGVEPIAGAEPVVTKRYSDPPPMASIVHPKTCSTNSTTQRTNLSIAATVPRAGARAVLVFDRDARSPLREEAFLTWVSTACAAAFPEHVEHPEAGEGESDSGHAGDDCIHSIPRLLSVHCVEGFRGRILVENYASLGGPARTMHRDFRRARP